MKSVSFPVSWLNPLSEIINEEAGVSSSEILSTVSWGISMRLRAALAFLPKPKASKFEFRKLFFDLPAQAIFIAFPLALATPGKHPSPIPLSSYETHPSAFRSHQFRGFRHFL